MIAACQRLASRRTRRKLRSRPESDWSWRLGNSVYADTIGTFHFVPPDPPLAGDVVFDTLTRSIADQTRALDDAKRAALFARLERDKRNDLTGADNAFLLAAKETAIDPAASATARAAAERFLHY